MTRITNRGSRDYKTGQLLGITNQDIRDYKSSKFRDYKTGQKDYRLGQGLQNGEKRLQIGSGITNRCRTDDTFPVGQLCIDGYSTPYCLNKTSHGGGILLYIREDIPSKMLKFDQVQNNFEVFFVEINLRKEKWLLSHSYNPNRKSIVNHEKNISTGLDQVSAT